MLAVVPEVSNDENGMIWPISIAPFEAVVMLLDPEDEAQCQAAVRYLEELQQAGVDVLLDERDERPGVKFKDSDLIGIPIQIVCGKFAAEGKVEVRLRADKSKSDVPIDAASAEVLELRGNCIWRFKRRLRLLRIRNQTDRSDRTDRSDCAFCHSRERWNPGRKLPF